jgi:hypothetical protein
MMRGENAEDQGGDDDDDGVEDDGAQSSGTCMLAEMFWARARELMIDDGWMGDRMAGDSTQLG